MGTYTLSPPSPSGVYSLSIVWLDPPCPAARVELGLSTAPAAARRLETHGGRTGERAQRQLQSIQLGDRGRGFACPYLTPVAGAVVSPSEEEADFVFATDASGTGWAMAEVEPVDCTRITRAHSRQLGSQLPWQACMRATDHPGER